MKGAGFSILVGKRHFLITEEILTAVSQDLLNTAVIRQKAPAPAPALCLWIGLLNEFEEVFGGLGHGALRPAALGHLVSLMLLRDFQSPQGLLPGLTQRESPCTPARPLAHRLGPGH